METIRYLRFKKQKKTRIFAAAGNTFDSKRNSMYFNFSSIKYNVYSDLRMSYENRKNYTTGGLTREITKKYAKQFEQPLEIL